MTKQFEFGVPFDNCINCGFELFKLTKKISSVVIVTIVKIEFVINLVFLQISYN